MNDQTSLSAGRREPLKTSGALVVSVSVPWIPEPALAQPGAAAKPPLTPQELDSWGAIHADGRVSAYYGKVDLRQGLEVAIAQIVAEQLDVTIDKVGVIMGDTATSLNQGGASSVLGIQAGAKPLHNAAAEARRIMVGLASKQLGVAPERLSVSDGVVASLVDAGKRVSYAELIAANFSMPGSSGTS